MIQNEWTISSVYHVILAKMYGHNRYHNDYSFNNYLYCVWCCQKIPALGQQTKQIVGIFRAGNFLQFLKIAWICVYCSKFYNNTLHVIPNTNFQGLLRLDRHL